MSMNAGGSGGRKADIDMTPMIDVLLVLIIIFMVITPLETHGLNTLIPQQSTVDPVQSTPSFDIVISIAKEREIHVNQEAVAYAALP